MSESFLKIDEPENFIYVQASLHWTFKALTEISFLNKERSLEEIELVNGAPFQFYRISLHYMFSMEYIKLMESPNKYPSNHFASLEKLSLAVNDLKGIEFKKTYKRHLKLLQEIKSSFLYSKLKGDRDKKLAHTDGDYPEPFSFKSLNDTELEEAYHQLDLFKIIMNDCTSEFGYSFVFQNPDTRTDNFIKYQTKYKEYYFKNFFKAMGRP